MMTDTADSSIVKLPVTINIGIGGPEITINHQNGDEAEEAELGEPEVNQGSKDQNADGNEAEEAELGEPEVNQKGLIDQNGEGNEAEEAELGEPEVNQNGEGNEAEEAELGEPEVNQNGEGNEAEEAELGEPEEWRYADPKQAVEEEEVVEVEDNSVDNPPSMASTGKAWQKLPQTFVEDPRKRQKVYNRKRRRILELAEDIHKMCAAKVDVNMYSESAKYSGYHSSKPTQVKNKKCQIGESAIVPRQSTRPRQIEENNTPTKRTTAALTQGTSAPPGPGTSAPETSTQGTSTQGPSSQAPTVAALPAIEGLPGKRKRKSIPPSQESSRCKVCRVIYLSPADISLKKEKKREWTWLGCMSDDCDYWAHAFCANTKVGRKKASDVYFYCPDHNEP